MRLNQVEESKRVHTRSKQTTRTFQNEGILAGLSAIASSVFARASKKPAPRRKAVRREVKPKAAKAAVSGGVPSKSRKPLTAAHKAKMAAGMRAYHRKG